MLQSFTFKIFILVLLTNSTLFGQVDTLIIENHKYPLVLKPVVYDEYSYDPRFIPIPSEYHLKYLDTTIINYKHRDNYRNEIDQDFITAIGGISPIDAHSHTDTGSIEITDLVDSIKLKLDESVIKWHKRIIPTINSKTGNYYLCSYTIYRLLNNRLTEYHVRSIKDNKEMLLDFCPDDQPYRAIYILTNLYYFKNHNTYFLKGSFIINTL